MSTRSVKIITDRALREGPAWDMMIRDVAGTDMERRDKALACLRFLGDSCKSSLKVACGGVSLIRRHYSSW